MCSSTINSKDIESISLESIANHKIPKDLFDKIFQFIPYDTMLLNKKYYNILIDTIVEENTMIIKDFVQCICSSEKHDILDSEYYFNFKINISGKIVNNTVPSKWYSFINIKLKSNKLQVCFGKKTYNETQNLVIYGINDFFMDDFIRLI